MNINEQLEIIKRGAVQVISEPELVAKLKSGRPLVIKAGFDPTAPDMHLGHTVLLRKLRQFQDLGHKVVFLIGDFTGRIGDPTGRSEIRKQLTSEEVLKNAQTYKEQVGKVLDLDKIKITFNGEWFDKMSGLELAQLLTHYTATRLLERDDFSKRIKEQKPLYMSEFIYPLLQGYDSVMLKSDIEIGGTDQVFNLLVGRNLQKDFSQEPQVVLTMPLLEGTDGVQKMSKSYGNYIGINDSPADMFGKIMSISDNLMFKYYELLTNHDLVLVKDMHPKLAKIKLAEEIVSQYYSSGAAIEARNEFEQVFAKSGVPEDVAVYKLSPEGSNIIEILMNSGLVASKNEARRLIAQSAVSFNDERLNKESIVLKDEGILKAGKRRFLKIQK